MKLEILIPNPRSEHQMISDALETVTIKRVDIGYELTGNDGVSIAVYRNWDPIEQMFRKADFSTEYIEMRKAEVDRGGETEIDETDE
jgi:hypothetical protein